MYYLVLLLLLPLLFLPYLLKRHGKAIKSAQTRTRKLLRVKGKLVGFFHPYCNAGGGGERVLWAAVRATLEEDAFCVIYSGDEEAKEVILRRAEVRPVIFMAILTQTSFGIKLDAARIAFIQLKKWRLVSPERWPRVTLLGQSIGSIVLCYEAMNALVPDVYIGTSTNATS